MLGLALALVLGAVVARAEEAADPAVSVDPSRSAESAGSPTLLAPFTVDPEIALGFPLPLSVGVELRRPDWPVRPFVQLGYARYPVLGGDRVVWTGGAYVGTRWSPFGGGFFLGWGGGWRAIGLSVDASALRLGGDQQLATRGRARADALVLAGTAGYSFALGERVTLAVEAGLQWPIRAWGSMKLEDEPTGATSDSSPTLYMDDGEAMRRIAGLPLPVVTLGRLTWRAF